MAVVSRSALKNYFLTGNRPTQAQFADAIDSFVSMNDADESASILGAKRFSGSVQVTGSLITGGAASIAGSAIIVGNLVVSGTASISGSLIANSTVIVTSTGTGASRASLADPNIAHGMTAQTDTTVFVELNRFGTCGGLQFRGFSGSQVGFQFTGTGTTIETGKTNSVLGAIIIQSNKKSGTGIGVMADNENMAVFRNNACARVIIQGSGDIYADSGITASAYDSYDDIGLIRTLEVERVPNLSQEFGNWVQYKREDLEKYNIAVFNDEPEGDGSVFVNYSALTRLHSGAIWQLAKKLDRLERALQLSGCNYMLDG